MLFRSTQLRGPISTASEFRKKTAPTLFRFSNSFAYSSRTSCSSGERVSAPAFVGDEGANSGADIEGVEAMAFDVVLG